MRMRVCACVCAHACVRMRVCVRVIYCPCVPVCREVGGGRQKVEGDL